MSQEKNERTTSPNGSRAHNLIFEKWSQNDLFVLFWEGENKQCCFSESLPWKIKVPQGLPACVLLLVPLLQTFG